MRAPSILLLACVAAWSSAGAQRLRGVVRDSATHEPLHGAVLTLSDSGGRYLARGVADAAGQFSVFWLDRSAKLSVVRIGYEPRTIPVAAPDTALVVLMHPIPLMLSAVTETSRRVCPADQGESQALTLWEQARAGLLSSVVSREANAPRIDLMSREREFEPVRKRLIEETTETKTLVGDRPYVAARPASKFAEEGYVLDELGVARTYFAPDEDVLLHESFVATHCLHVVEGKDAHAGDVGIGFEPADLDGRDTLVDIKGVLWIDRTGPALHSLDFEYTGLERAGNGGGGEIVFQTMPTGTPIIRRWTIHFAILAADLPDERVAVRRSPPPRTRRADVRVLGYRETSGEVGAAEWPDGTKWRGTLPRVVGRVVDTAGNPAAAARVILAGWPRSRDTIVTGPDGQFVSPFLMGSNYAVFAVEGVFAGTGLVGSLPVNARTRGADTQVELVLPSRRAMLRTLCAGKPYTPGSGVIIGHATAADGSPADGVRVAASWAPPEPEPDISRSVETGAHGQFVICGVALNRGVRVRASTRHESADVVLDVRGSDVIPLDLALKPRP